DRVKYADDPCVVRCCHYTTKWCRASPAPFFSMRTQVGLHDQTAAARIVVLTITPFGLRIVVSDDDLAADDHLADLLKLVQKPLGEIVLILVERGDVHTVVLQRAEIALAPILSSARGSCNADVVRRLEHLLYLAGEHYWAELRSAVAPVGVDANALDAFVVSSSRRRTQADGASNRDDDVRILGNQVFTDAAAIVR